MKTVQKILVYMNICINDKSDVCVSLFTQPPSGRRQMRICFADVFFCFFLFFFRPPKL